MDIEVGSVSWVSSLTFDDERESALIADVGELQNCTMKPEGDRYAVFHSFGRDIGWVQYDHESGKENHEIRCVVVGRIEGSVAKEYYYVLVVVPTREDGEYRRVGLGMVPTGSIEWLRAGVRIV